MDEVFSGFPGLVDGYTQMPNAWFNILQGIDNMAELKIVLYVIRHTWGYRNEDDERDETKKISTDEFAYGRKRRDGSRIDRGTGLGLTAVKEGVSRALKHQYLTCIVDNSDLARTEKHYGLKMLEEDEGEEDLDGHNPTTDSRNPTTDGHNPTSSGLNSASGGLESDYRSEKETSDKNFGKETERNIAHSQFFDEAVTFLKKKRKVTYYELERFLHRFMRVRGDCSFQFPGNKNAIVWQGVSQEYSKVVMELQARKYITVGIADESAYQKARKPRLPIGIDANCKEPHWFPRMIIYIKEEE